MSKQLSNADMGCVLEEKHVEDDMIFEGSGDDSEQVNVRSFANAKIVQILNTNDKPPTRREELKTFRHGNDALHQAVKKANLCLLVSLRKRIGTHFGGTIKPSTQKIMC
ncbi:unnamed protein product [Parnassius apollo]|uniref:(apollo) hypothetical protein n=1 Tax=Parnassius apollo TaxID=110799 RepID=A0A8S3W7Q4_PARAO|nr:unnamed protein product [Parnassius apollo]